MTLQEPYRIQSDLLANKACAVEDRHTPRALSCNSMQSMMAGALAFKEQGIQALVFLLLLFILIYCFSRNRHLQGKSNEKKLLPVPTGLPKEKAETQPGGASWVGGIGLRLKSIHPCFTGILV